MAALQTLLIAAILVLSTGLAISFYHEVILADVPCGFILGHVTDPSLSCGGKPFPQFKPLSAEGHAASP